MPLRTSPAQVPAIGRDGQNSRYYFPGDVDDVIVWRRALDAVDVEIHDVGVFADGLESGNAFAWTRTAP